MIEPSNWILAIESIEGKHTLVTEQKTKPNSDTGNTFFRFAIHINGLVGSVFPIFSPFCTVEEKFVKVENISTLLVTPSGSLSVFGSFVFVGVV